VPDSIELRQVQQVMPGRHPYQLRQRFLSALGGNAHGREIKRLSALEHTHVRSTDRPKFFERADDGRSLVV
jgi:hypothetical protein